MSKALQQFTEEELEQLMRSGVSLSVFEKKLDISGLVRENRRLANQLRSVSAARSRIRRQLRREA